MRIFVVDDDRDLAESLAEVLELSGHEVEIAFSGEQAVEIFRQRDFDISFMDVVMPGMNGVESFLEIRKIKPDAKVFMLTGYSVTQLLEQAIENGALGVLEKPIGVEELLGKIDGMKQEQQEGMVLVADDDPAFRESMVEVLKQQGYNVCIATTGQEAVDKVMAGGIDVLALDLRLPVLSGVEVYLELKNRGHALPTVIMSGHINEESEAVSTLCDMSVTGILTKPFDPAHLIGALDRIVPAAANGAKPAAATPNPNLPEPPAGMVNTGQSAPQPAAASPDTGATAAPAGRPSNNAGAMRGRAAAAAPDLRAVPPAGPAPQAPPAADPELRAPAPADPAPQAPRAAEPADPTAPTPILRPTGSS